MHPTQFFWYWIPGIESTNDKGLIFQQHEAPRSIMGRRAKGVNSFLMPSFSFTDASVNYITTIESKRGKSFLVALKGIGAQNMKARASSGDCVLPFWASSPGQ